MLLPCQHKQGPHRLSMTPSIRNMGTSTLQLLFLLLPPQRLTTGTQHTCTASVSTPTKTDAPTQHTHETHIYTHTLPTNARHTESGGNLSDTRPPNYPQV